MPRNLQPQKYLASIFVVEPAWGSSAKLAKHLAQMLGKEGIDVSAMPLEVPAEAPPEIPRIALVSVTQSWQVYASFMRIDLNLLPSRLGESDRRLSSAEFWFTAGRLFSRLLEELALDVNRIAAVLEAAADTTDTEGSPDDYVRRRFLSADLPQGLHSDTHDSEAHVYQRPRWSTEQREVVLNKIFRIKALHANILEGKRNSLFIEIDCNTIPDDPSIRFSGGELKAFYEQMPKWTKDTISGCLEGMQL